MSEYKIPSSSQVLGTIQLDKFDGVDFTSTPSICSPYRSPDSVNSVRITPGKVGKRTGYEIIESGIGKINGHHVLQTLTGEIEYIHAGTNLYKYTPSAENHLTAVYTAANNAKSVSVMLGGALWFLDGLKLLKITEESVVTAESIAKVPKIITGRAPASGGVLLEPINLLTAKRYEGFYADGTSTTFQLTATDIDSVEKVQKLVGADYTDVSTSDYTVNLVSGQIAFTTAPSAGSDGKDNILIYYSKTVSGYADRVNKCTTATLFGIGGAQDRMFITGNPDMPGTDWFCELRDPSYWGDLWYGALGDENSAILNYSIVDNKLAAFKENGENNVNVFLRSGTLETVTETVNTVEITYYDPAFEIVGTYQSEDIIARHSFQVFDNETVYLTTRGIHALTLVSLTNERNSELRSYYLNGRDKFTGLLAESNLEDAHSIVFDGFYILCVNNHCYLLDSLQSVTEKGTLDSNSRKQYEGFYWTGIPANIMWVQDNILYFGTADGKICRFYTDAESAVSYYDGTAGDTLGTPVEWYWCTAHLRGKYEFNNMTVITFGYILSAYVATGINAFIRVNGIFKSIVSGSSSGRYFTYEPFSYEPFTYSGDSTEQTYNRRVRIARKVDKVQIKLENDLAEPVAIEQMEIYYRQGGKYKNRG